MEEKILRADVTSPEELFQHLSALDKLCVGVEGWSAESFRSEASKENGIVLYIPDENGGVSALLSGYHAVGEGDITSVAVAPEYRRRGLALRLMERFAELLPDDTESIFLEVRESNAAAVSLYEKCGFTKLSVRRDFYDSPRENAIVMVKKCM